MDSVRDWDDVNGNGIRDPGEAWTETDPRLPDSDFDGLMDGYDVTHPVDSHEAVMLISRHPHVYSTRTGGEITFHGELTGQHGFAPTDPNDPDSDGDGAMDGAEVRGWTVIIYRQISYEEIERREVRSDPNKNDTDGDGLLDGLEMGYSDPTNPDTDGDGRDDKWEYDNGSPLNAIDGTAPRLHDLAVGRDTVYEEVVEVNLLGYRYTVKIPVKYVFHVSFTAVDGGGLSSIGVNLDGGTSASEDLDG